LGSQSNNLGIVSIETLKSQQWFIPQTVTVSNSLSSGTPFTLSYGTVSGTPIIQLTIICTNAASADGYAAGDEIPLLTLQDPGETNCFQVHYSSAGINFNQSSRPIRVFQKNSPTLQTNLIQSNWNIKAVVTVYP
jgi:hypothetical protein